MSLQAFDSASLEAFVADLVAAGFEPVPGTDRRRWRAPIHRAFSPLTDARTMDLVLLDGWPLEPPALLVDGLDTNHSTLAGLVCMWREDDTSLRWTSVEGLFERMVEWCHDAQEGWGQRDLGRDAYLNFGKKIRVLATFDLTKFRTSVGAWGDFYGLRKKPRHVDFVPGRAPASTVALPGLWFLVGQLKVPARNLAELQRCLTRSQWRGLQRALTLRKKGELLQPSGGVDLIMLVWERNDQMEVLAMACEGTRDEMDALALQTGPSDEENLILRAGPDAPSLKPKSIVVFGAGAIGGHAAVALAESGVGRLRLVDGELLTPGNVVRHVCGHDQVGMPKIEAVHLVVKAHAPWTEVETRPDSPLKPDAIRDLIRDADVVVDTTGNGPATMALAITARHEGKPLVSAALYRGGFVGRIRRQALPSDTWIDQRADSERYPIIPPDEDGADLASAEIGCSAPVNNAPPTSVMSCASLVVQSAIDILTERFDLGDEVIDVYRPLPGSPHFARPGRVILPEV